MTVKTILNRTKKLLRQISKPVGKSWKRRTKLMDDMLETMYSANGIGLSCNSNRYSKKNNCNGY